LTPTLYRKAFFLDRDGVINNAVVRDGKPYPPANQDEFEYLPRAIEAIDALNRAGWLTVVVTNQPDVRTGKQERRVVEAMHWAIRKATRIDDIFVCFHVDEDGCLCRKPKPGMLQAAARRWSIDLAKSYMVGDRWRDIEAGQNAGCQTILVKSDYDELQPDRPDAVVDSLWDASQLILSSNND